MKIDIPKILLELRSDVKKSEAREKQNRLEKLGFRVFAWMMTHPRLYEMAGRIAASVARSAMAAGSVTRRADEFRPGEGVAQPARPAAACRGKSFREMWSRR